MPRNPHASCVIPVFNGARFLGDAIESVLAQRDADLEIIVVDDGSTDATPDVAKRFGDQVVYLRQENAGSASARNRGIRHATGAYVAMLDSDDLWHPDKMAMQLARFEARPELVLCGAHMRNFWSEEVAHEVAALADERLTEIQPNLGSSLVARRSLFDSIGLLNTSFRHRDLQEFVVRAMDQGLATETLPDVLVSRRIHDANISRHRSDAGDVELLEIARLRMARRRQPPK